MSEAKLPLSIIDFIFLPKFELLEISFLSKAPVETFIKLYNYKARGLYTNIVFDLYNRISLLLHSIALPIRFYERRLGYTGHTFEANLAGLSVRVADDRNQNLEEGYPSSAKINIGKSFRIINGHQTW